MTPRRAAAWAFAVAGALALPALAAAASPAQPAPAVAFYVPAQVGGEAAVASAQWALLVFHGGPAKAALSLPEGAEGATHTVVAAGAREPVGLVDSFPSEPVERPVTVGPGDATLGFPEGSWGSLFILADRIEATLSGQGSLDRAEPGEALEPLLPWPPAPRGTLPPFPHHAPSGAAALAHGGAGTPSAVQVAATGLRRIEWYNATVHCSMACPDGPSYQPWSVPGMAGDRVEVRNYTTLDLPGGKATLGGLADAVLLGGRALDVAVDGWARLPQVELEGCDACGRGRTLRLEGGGIALRGLSPQGQGHRLHGTLDAPSALATLDEERGVPLAAAVAGVAAGGGLAVAALALLRFRARKAAADPGFGHRRRSGLFELVVREPGLSFREVGRRLGWGNGVTRHHLDVLVEDGHLVARRHLNTVRYFENHGRFDADWQAVVHRRDPDSRWLLDVIREAPRTQVEAIALAAGRGWTRSATQRRLARLVADGVVAWRRSGEGRRYTVLEAPAAAGPARRRKP